jgi:hypothetical protein
MLRNLFALALIGALGLVAFGVFGVLAGLAFGLIGLLLKLAFFGAIIYLIIRLVAPDTAQRLRQRFTGGGSDF